MSITSIPIRATIKIGNLTIKTPYILSFNVRKVRNSKTTFSASLKVPAESLRDNIGNEVSIAAGEKGYEKAIFSGFVLSSRPSNCFDDPNYVILNVSGADALYKLEGQFFTRRVIDSQSQWAVIESVIRPAGKGSQFQVSQLPTTIVDRHPTDVEEADNKNGVSSSLLTLGTEKGGPHQIYIDFRFGPITSEDSE